MAKNTAPRDVKGAATHNKSFAAGAAAAGDVDLTAQSGKPAHAPQLCDLKNNHATAQQNAVLNHQDGSVFTVVLNPGQEYPAFGPWDSIDQTCGADVTVKAYWWHGNSIPFNA